MKSSSTLKTLFILTISFNIFLVSSALVFPNFNGYQIVELSSTTTDAFSFEGKTWNTSGLVSALNQTSICAGLPILGGYNILSPYGSFSKKMLSLPPHTMLIFEARFFIIDNFYSSDTVVFQIAETNFTANNLTWAKYLSTTNFCGDSGVNDLNTYRMMGKLTHTASDTIVKIISKVSTSPTTASFGLRYLSIIFSNTTSANASCFRAFDTKVYNSAGECKCISKNYLNPLNSSQCLSCNAACFDCFGPSSSQCYSCSSGHSFTGTSCTKCDITCNTCSGPNSNQCITCQSGFWLYANGTCQSSCDFPSHFTQAIGDFKVCKLPCNATGQYTLWNGTCGTYCPPPFMALTIDQAKLCNKPCQDSEFLYWNNSCLSTCVSPNIQGIINDENAGILTCTQNATASPNNTTNSTVTTNTNTIASLNTTNSTNTTKASVDKVADQVKQTTTAMNIAGKVTSVGIAIASVASSTRTGSLSLSSLIKMLQYIRYMEVNYPPKVQLMLNAQDKSYISLGISTELPHRTQKMFPSYTLPGKFKDYQVPSSFFINYWDALANIIMVVGIIFLVIIGTSFAPETTRTYRCFKKVRSIVQWNIFIMIFCANFDGIVLFSSFEFRNVHLSSPEAYISFITCILANIVAVIVFIQITKVIKELRKAKYRTYSLDQAKRIPFEKTKNLESYRIIFKELKDKSILQQAFLPIFIARVCIFNAIIAYLFAYPLTQAILITLLSMTMLLYLIIQRPQKEKLENIELVLNEFIILIVNLNVLILAVLDSKDYKDLEVRNQIGDVIYFANIAFSFMALGLMCLKTIIGFIEVIKVYRLLKEKYRGISLIKQMLVNIFDEEEKEEAFESPLSLDERNFSESQPPSAGTLKHRPNFKSDSNLENMFPLAKERVAPSFRSSIIGTDSRRSMMLKRLVVPDGSSEKLGSNDFSDILSPVVMEESPSYPRKSTLLVPQTHSRTLSMFIKQRRQSVNIENNSDSRPDISSENVKSINGMDLSIQQHDGTNLELSKRESQPRSALADRRRRRSSLFTTIAVQPEAVLKVGENVAKSQFCKVQLKQIIAESFSCKKSEHDSHRGNSNPQQDPEAPIAERKESIASFAKILEEINKD